ncbi:hypothetical protein JCM14469_02080 [Desulfatiferula olefinivorans]
MVFARNVSVAVAAAVVVGVIWWIRRRKAHALHDAAAAGDLARIDALIAGGHAADAIYEEVTPLHVAVMRNRLDAAAHLIAKGASVTMNTAADTGVTPLHIAATIGNAEMTDLLIAHGADVEARASNGETPILTAARFGHKELVHRLLGHGASLEATDAKGDSMLFTCIFSNDTRAASVLLEAGMDPNVMDKDRQASALHAAMVLALHTGDTEMVECLLAHGADPHVKDHHGMTPLKMAKIAKKDALVTLLTARGAGAFDAKGRS